MWVYIIISPKTRHHPKEGSRRERKTEKDRPRHQRRVRALHVLRDADPDPAASRGVRGDELRRMVGAAFQQAPRPPHAEADPALGIREDRGGGEEAGAGEPGAFREGRGRDGEVRPDRGNALTS